MREETIAVTVGGVMIDGTRIGSSILRKFKTAAQNVMPAAAYMVGAEVWRGAVGRCRTLRIAFRSGIPNTVLFFGGAPGDDLLCTAVLHEFRRRGHKRIWMISNHPELFAEPDDVARILPVTAKSQEYAQAWARVYRRLEYAPFDAVGDRSSPPKRHIIAELCARAGIMGKVALRPYLTLTEDERSTGAWARNYIAIQSSGLSALFPMRNKQWFPERFQAVVDTLRGKFEFVQLGLASDPALQYAKDLRGATGLREAGAILAHARLFVGSVGFLMHLARAAECPAVIVYGGREAPWQSGYSCNTNLYSPELCAPCWRWNTCDYGKVCMERISVADVVGAIDQRLSESPGPLSVDIVDI